MYLSHLARRCAIRLLPLVLVILVLAPLAPAASCPPVTQGSTVESTAPSVNLFDFVRVERGVTIVIDG